MSGFHAGTHAPARDGCQADQVSVNEVSTTLSQPLMGEQTRYMYFTYKIAMHLFLVIRHSTYTFGAPRYDLSRDHTLG